MKKRNETENKYNHSVRRKWKRVIAVALSLLMVISVIDYSGLLKVKAQSGTKIIAAFAGLPEDISNQQLTEGASEADIILPDTLPVTVKSFLLENVVQNDEPEPPEVVETVTEESSEDQAVPPSQTEETVILDTTEPELEVEPETEWKEVLEDITLENITWRIQASGSTSDLFDSSIVGAAYTYEPTLPEGYTLADGVSLPQIRVQIEESGNWAFTQSQTIDGITITVKAETDVFPEGAILTVKKVTKIEDKEKIQEAVTRQVQAQDTAKTVTELVSFDITITDIEGNELQPDTSKGQVRVSFAQLPMVTEVAAPTKELKVFHMDDSLSEAKGLDTTVNEETESVEAIAEHFSVYTVADLTDEIRANVEAEVKAADGTLTYYDTIEEAITAAQGMSSSTVTLLKDVATENKIEINFGNLSIDLHGKTWTGPEIWEVDGQTNCALEIKGTPTLVLKDTVGGGVLTSVNPYKYVILNFALAADISLEGGTYSGISNCKSIGSLLPDGYAYKNSESGEWITNMNGSSISNVTVAEAPIELMSASVTQAGGTVHHYLTIERAITAAQGMSGSTVTLLKDAETENYIQITSGTFTLDLNGKSLNNTQNAGVSAFILSGSSNDSMVSLTVKDSVGGGSITTIKRFSIYSAGYCALTLEGGSYTGIQWGYNNVGDVLGTDCVYRNYSDSSVVTDTSVLSGYDIFDVKVTPAPVKVTEQPEDAVVAPGYTEAPTFTITAETIPVDSGKTITYQWYKDSVAIGGATSASYTVDTGLSEGTYTYYCAVTCDGYTVNTRDTAFYVTSLTGNYSVTASNGSSVNYPTLELAITAAKSKPNSTVKLLADATTADRVVVNSATCTIDLNGNTWTSNGLRLENGSHVTLMDSAGGGKLTTTTAYATISVSEADLTIKSGIYENERNDYMSWVLEAYTSGTVTIQGGTLQTSKSLINLVYLQRVDVVISGGTFSSGRITFHNCNSVSLSGGEYKYIDTNGTDIVANLLTSGYGYKNQSDNTWVNRLANAASHVNDLAHTFLQYPVRIEPVPVTITDHPGNATNKTYGYTSAPTMSVSAEKTAAAPTGSEISYQWYRVKSGSETSDTPVGLNSSSLTLPTGLDAGTHSVYCKVTCDGYIVNSEPATVTVEKATPTITLDVIVYEDDPFIYGNLMYFTATVTGANGEYPDGTVTLMDGDDVLFSDVDYDTYSHFYQKGSDDVPAGTHSFTAIYTPSTDGTGKNYVGVTSAAVERTIAKADLTGVTVTGNTGEYHGDETCLKAYTISGTIPDGVKEYYQWKLEDGSWSNGGTYWNLASEGGVYLYKTGSITVRVKLSGDNYNDYISDEVTSMLSPKNISDSDISIDEMGNITDKYYTGSAIEQDTVEIRYNSFYLSPETDYDLSYENNVSVGEASLIVTGKGNYTGTVTKKFNIEYYNGMVTLAYNGSTSKADWYTTDVAITADGYTVSDSVTGTYAASYLLSGEGEVSKTLYFKENGTGYITEEDNVWVKIDKIAPVFSGDTDGITISDNNWKQFLNQITFGLFFTETKDVSILATDNGSGVEDYYYYIDAGSTTAKTAEELNAISFTKGNSCSITDENRYVIYAYAVDYAGNKSAYIGTDGIVMDKTAPTVTLTTPAGSELGDVSATAKVQMSETGTITYLVTTSEQSGMTVEHLVAEGEKKTLSVTEEKVNTNCLVLLTNLTANTTYYMYAVGTDSAGNNSEVKHISFTTSKTMPVFSSNPTITGTYGQPVKDMTISQPGSTNGIAGSWSASSTAIPSVGTAESYVVVFTPDHADQHDTVSVLVTPTVNPKSLTVASVTIGEVSGTPYTGTAQEPTVTVTDSMATITASDYEYSYSNNIHVGTATVTVTGRGNYTGSVSRTFSITKAPAPTITYPTASSITYGQKLSVSTLSGGDTQYGTFTWSDGSTVPTVTNSGYEVTFTPNANTLANYEDINHTTDTVALIVSKATPAVTVNATISGDAGARQAVLVATVTGVGDGDIPTGSVEFINRTSGSDASIAGATAVTITGGKATYTWTGLASQMYRVKAVYNGSANYNTATSTELSFDTNKENQAPLMIGNLGTKTYGDPNFTLATTGGTGNGVVSYTSSNPSVVSISGSTATIHKAGSVTISATKAATDSYNEVNASVTLTVGKKTLLVKADNKFNLIKGAGMPELTFTVIGLVGSDTFTNPAISTTAADTDTVGDYDILISGGTLTNADSYAVTYIGGKLTVIHEPVSPGGSSGGGGSVPDTTQPAAGTPVIKDSSNKAGWEAIKEQIHSTQNGATITVDMNGTLIVPKEVLDTIRGTKVTLVFDMGDGITWSVNGRSMTDSTLEDIDLGVTMDTDAIPEKLIQGVAKKQAYRSVSLAHNGKFGFTAVLTINMEKQNAGSYANLFYHNPTSGKLELKAIQRVNEKGYVEYQFTHASDYVVVLSKDPMYANALERISISATKGTLYVGGTKDKSRNLTVKLLDLLQEVAKTDNAPLTVTYKSSNPNVATVTSTGKIIAKKTGKTTITTQVKLGDKRKSFQTTITVKKAYIKLTKSTKTLKQGTSFTFQAKGYGVNTADIQFYSTKKSIITINKRTGRAVAKSAGTSYIIAKAGKVVVKVKVKVK